MGGTSFSWKRLLVRSGMCALVLAAPAHAADQPPAGPQAEDDRIIAQARASYYSLKDAGMTEFRCRIVPNIDNMLVIMRKTDAADADLRAKILAKTRFDLVVPLRGKATLTHSYDGEVPANPTVDQVYDGMDKSTRGFFQIWTGFMVQGVFPAAGQPYVLEKAQSQYYLSSVDGGSIMFVAMDQDLLVSRMKINDRNFRVTISPRFEKVGGKLVLIGYDATDQAVWQDMKIEFHVKIDNQLVDGLQLPRRYEVQGMVNGQAFDMALTFTDCHVSRGDVIAPAVKK